MAPAATRRRLATVLALAAAMLCAVPGSALGITKKAADRAALAALKPEKAKDDVVLFRVPKPLKKGAVVSESGPAAPTKGKRVGKTDVFRYPVQFHKLKAKAWLYWLDLAPEAGFQHPSVLLLIDNRTGKVVKKFSFSWYPLVNGKRAPFVQTRAAYHKAGFRVFATTGPRVTPAFAGLPGFRRPFAQAAITGPPKLTGECIVTIGDRKDPLFNGDFELAKTTAKILKIPYREATSAEDLERQIEDLVKAGCKDVLIGIFAHGYPPRIPKIKNPKTGKPVPTSAVAQVQLKYVNTRYIDSSGKFVVETKDFNIHDLNKAIKKHKAKFKVIVGACFSGRWTDAAINEQVVFVATSSRRDQFSYGNLEPGYDYDNGTQKDGVKTDTGGTKTDETTNPTRAGEFGNGFFRGLLAWAGSDRPDDDFLGGLRYAFAHEGDNDFAAQLGWTNPQIAGSASVAPPPPQPPPPPPPPPPPSTDYSVSQTPGWHHIAPGSSEICSLFSTSPPKPGAIYFAKASGPALSGPTERTGSLDAGGQGRASFPISNTGEYTIEVTITADGVSRTTSTTFTVTYPAEPGCP